MIVVRPRPRAVLSRPGAVLLLAFLAGAGSAPGAAAAQERSGADVRAAVDAVFEGMAAADSSMVRARFAPTARFAMKSRDGSEIVARPVDSWIDAIATSEGRWNEQIYDVVVHVDDDVAQVWAPYTFYLDGEVSHCGVNTIELLSLEGRWLITQISDSRRTGACPDPLASRGS